MSCEGIDSLCVRVRLSNKSGSLGLVSRWGSASDFPRSGSPEFWARQEFRDGVRILSGFFCALFVVAAAVQWNDPDPLLWIMGYLLAAILSAGLAWGRTWTGANAGAAVFFALWFATLAPSLMQAEQAAFETFEMSEARHEEPREAVGVGLAAGWCAALALYAQKRNREDSN